MKKIDQEIDFLLQGYLDGNLEGEKLDKIKRGLEKSEVLRSRLEVLKMIQHSLSQSKLEDPSSNFTKVVMSKLHQVPSSSTLSPKNGLLLLLGVLVASGIAITMLDLGIFNSMNGMISFDNLVLPDKLPNYSIPSISLNGKLMINILIALNLGLAFLILDRTILRPLFHKRSRIQY